jgi:hypothetical protein
MKMYIFQNEGNNTSFHTTKSEDLTYLSNLKNLGYSDSIQEAKNRQIQLIEDYIANIKNNTTKEVNELLLKIDFIKNF